ncbi:methyl-accepting chemotaxis protein [Evansella caseinilytica]|uniref:Methyl-accepting chemotaxis protein n=1 Tax=Evansella caseinilytica TaxID=1503961 RepID=A0A1H3HZR2_9BACI|nr:methyl-accepting chemotaxis protein [Evansella caseinilytica]SDY20966.1 methyl-accepting chemotaxis protein [Evansella caseinilytica]
MNKKKRPGLSFSFKNKLILSFLVILLVPSITIALTSYKSAEGNIDNRMAATALNNVNIAEEAINQFINAQKENIDFLSNAIVAGNIVDDHDDQTRELLDTIQNSKADVEQTFVGTENGSFMNSPTSFQNPPDYDPRERPWYNQAMENKGEVIITDPYISQSSEQVVVTIAKVTADGQGVVAINLKLESLTNIINDIEIGEEGYVFLVDKANNIISHPALEAGEQFAEPFFEKIKDTESGSFDDKSGKTVTKIAFETSDTTGWKVVASMAQSEVTHAVQPILQTTLFVIIGAFLAGAVIIWLMIKAMMKPINQLVKAADNMSEGDLSVEVDLQRNDELGTLAAAFNRMRENLSTLILQIRDKSATLAASSEQLTASTEQNTSASEQISSSVQQMTSGVETQAENIEQSSKMAEEMSESIQHISDNTNEVSANASNASSVIQEGNHAIETTVGQMNYIKKTVADLSSSIQGLGKFSEEISQIVDVITSIAEQTNLLALNAAIEAARAGENGKGFAVVADEVRKLAEQSSQSAEQIREMIVSIQEETTRAVDSMKIGTAEVDKGIEVVNHAGESFSNMTGFVNSITEQIKEITAKMTEISTGTEQFVRTFENVAVVADSTAQAAQDVSASTQEQLASMEEIQGSANTLTLMAEEMQQLVERFKL